MAKQNQSETTEPVAEDKPKRKTSTPEERIAKLEAELEAARQRAEKKANKERTVLQAKRDKVAARIDVLQQQLGEIDSQLEKLS